ncbi:MAG: hypothetical protein ACF8AM_14490 [Rhodopirellula sp. JB055]|uniref:hypothetical protein n=1 Tax=Rhodopirellula sp. JB055 TaxID=3342846 RepID=UPI00370C70ED
MPTLRQSIRPTLCIVLAATLVVFLISPLDETQWAAGIRAGASANGGEGSEGSGPGGPIRFIGPIVKMSILMGVPALITLGIRRLIRRFRVPA